MIEFLTLFLGAIVTGPTDVQVMVSGDVAAVEIRLDDDSLGVLHTSPWQFEVDFSEELEPGTARPARYFGKDLVIWRTSGGEPRVFDAFCPHLGAHLGHGGKVEGDSIRCPFHAWSFDGAGNCIDIPYAKRVPPKAGVRSWPVLERGDYCRYGQCPE